MNERSTSLLELKKIRKNSRLMRLLPADIARQYHALPISTDGSRITIAMAHPEDAVACEVVTSAIGTPACMVKGDRQEIDQMLSAVWPQHPSPPLRLLLWNLSSDVGKDIQLYTRQFAELLHADLKEVNTPWLGVKSFDAIIGEAEEFHPDLIVFQIVNFPWVKRLLVDIAVNKLIDRLSSSILVVKNPRWPLKKILFAILDGHELNESAVDWVIRLAHCSHAGVTIMPLVPPVPEMYGQFIRNSLPDLLTSSDPLGEKMRKIADRMATEEIEGTFNLRNGPPLEQLRSEVVETDTDMLVIAAEPQSHVWRWIVGELVNDLFVWCDRPLLILKPTIN